MARMMRSIGLLKGKVFAALMKKVCLGGEMNGEGGGVSGLCPRLTK